MATAASNGKTTAIEPVSNDGADAIAFSEPYVAHVTIEGTAAILFHRWSNEAVAEKAAAAKNSRAKKTDNLESYVYRLDSGNLALPGEYLRQSLIGAARFRQDPRSPRKSAMDLFKAAVVPLTELADLDVKDWDYLDRRRVLIQRNAITRERPALKVRWPPHRRRGFPAHIRQVRRHRFRGHPWLRRALAGSGRAWCGLAWSGKARRGWRRSGVPRSGVVGLGWASYAMARSGKGVLGCGAQRNAWARQGLARRARARQAGVRCGTAWPATERQGRARASVVPRRSS